MHSHSFDMLRHFFSLFQSRCSCQRFSSEVLWGCPNWLQRAKTISPFLIQPHSLELSLPTTWKSFLGFVLGSASMNSVLRLLCLPVIRQQLFLGVVSGHSRNILLVLDAHHVCVPFDYREKLFSLSHSRPNLFRSITKYIRYNQQFDQIKKLFLLEHYMSLVNCFTCIFSLLPLGMTTTARSHASLFLILPVWIAGSQQVEKYSREAMLGYECSPWTVVDKINRFCTLENAVTMVQTCLCGLPFHKSYGLSSCSLVAPHPG